MRPSRIKAKLARDEPALVTSLHLVDASIYELVGLMGFDGIWMDMEHHTVSLATAAGALHGGSMARRDDGDASFKAAFRPCRACPARHLTRRSTRRRPADGGR